jgi:hypothetical protein
MTKSIPSAWVVIRTRTRSSEIPETETKIRDCGPRANYADRATAACWRSVPYGSHNKQRLFPQTALTGWAL